MASQGQSSQGQSAIVDFHDAVLDGDLDRASRLIQGGVDVSALAEGGGFTALHFSVSLANETMLKMLLDSGAQATLATDDGVTALHTAAFHGSEAASRLLVDAGANVSAVNFDQETPLHVAAMFGHTAVVKLLIESNSCLEVWEFLVDDASRQGKACRTWSPWPLAPE